MSFGMRSGVHWMRWNEPSIAEASVWAAVVFARPGTDSRRMCPPARSALTSAVRSASWPTTRWSKTWPTRLSRWLARSRSCVEMLPCPAAIERPSCRGCGPCAAEGGRSVTSPRRTRPSMPGGAPPDGARSTGPGGERSPPDARRAPPAPPSAASAGAGERPPRPVRRGSHPRYPGLVTTTALRRAQSDSRPANPWWLVLAGPLAVVVAIVAVLAAGAFSSAFTVPVGFPDPGALARLGTPVVTVLTELAVAVTVGSLVLAACVLPAGTPVRKALGVAGAASATWAVLAVVQVVLRYFSISGAPVAPVPFRDLR